MNILVAEGEATFCGDDVSCTTIFGTIRLATMIE